MKQLLTVTLISICNNIISAHLADPLQVKSYTLSNGLTVWLNEDHSQPKVFGAVVVKAGAKDSPNTGIAHYFEHIMFKGTDKIGTTDYKSEQVLLDSISNCYDKLAQTGDPLEREKIQMEINLFSIKAANYVIPNEFNRLISRFGGSNLNAITSYDFTAYYNTFSSQYIAHWAELNSERVINPVFRMFQNELETVYEEKNMYRDATGRDAIEKFITRFFHPHPYAYPIIGSTEHLKNPRLSEMQAFFEKYYVASNMGIILSGDFDSETTLPILEKTFSRIRKGEPPVRKIENIPPFNGVEKFQIRFPIPIVSGAGYAFRGVQANHPDQVPMNIVVGLLNNSNGTGFFDKLMVNRKLMAAMTMQESFNDAGFLAIIAIPRLVFQSVSSASRLIRKEVERIKTGDFSDEIFNSLKLEQKRKYTSRLEDIGSRSEMMINLFSQEKSWDDYIREIERIDELKKEDIVRIANKYFIDNHLYVTKKTGKYPKDNLPKPNYLPVVPNSLDASSEYAIEMEKLPVREVLPRFLDLEKDVQITPLTDLVKLYSSVNPVNDIFTLDISFGTGKAEHPELTLLPTYLPLLGTEKLPFDYFRGRLQTLGSTLSFDVDQNNFSIRISGFDANFSETIELVASFMQQAKPEKNKMKQLVDEEKVFKKTFLKTSESIASAILEKVRYGEKSMYLNKLSLQDIKNLKGKDLLNHFRELQKVSCNIFYCGTLPVDTVIKCIRENIRLDEITIESQSPVYRPLLKYDSPVVFFYDIAESSQSIIYSYIRSESPLENESSRHASRLFSSYFGGDMSSLMFQEIREFRSFAYVAQGRYSQLNLKFKDKPGALTTMLSTQNDKAIDAITVLDRLLHDMPVKPERLPAVKQSLINHISDDYPTFRKIPGRIASILSEGYSEDPNIAIMEKLSQMEMNDIVKFYEENIKDKTAVYIIAGNSRQIDMKKLSKFGKIVTVKKEDIYN